MTKNKILNHILRTLHVNGVCTKSYSDLFRKLDPSITPQQHDFYLSYLVKDGLINRTTGFGANNYEIEISDAGIIFIAEGGYPEYDAATLKIISHEKAIDKLIEVYQSAYSHSLTFDDFYDNHLKQVIAREKAKQLIRSLFEQGILPGLPIDFQTGTKRRVNIEAIVNKVMNHWAVKLILAIAGVAGLIALFL